VIDIYDNIIAGLNEHKPTSLTTEVYLRSLQPSVRELRKSYYSHPVHVPYHKHEIQASYLIAYLPHYYQLIYSILNNDSGEVFKKKAEVNLGFIGGGAGSEIYGVIKFITNNCKWVTKINVTVFDINAEAWKFSHGIVLKNLIRSSEDANKLSINWNAIQFNLVNEKDIAINASIVKSLDLLVIQNCINEIARQDIPILKKVIVQLFQGLPSNAYLLISDLTSSVRSLMKSLESEIEKGGGINFKVTTLDQPNPTSIISVHHQPNKVIRENLMTGADGLIPRKNLKYDYTLLSRAKVSKKSHSEAVGLMALYSPLEYSQIDANDFVHSKSFIGLDFGTSTTVVSCAVIKDDKLEVNAIPIPQKDKEGHPTFAPLVPTVMSLVGNIFMVGRYASERKSIMVLGKDIWYGFKENLPNLSKILYDKSILKNHPQLKISTAKEALVVFFKYLNKEVIAYLGAKNLPIVTEYTVTIPAGFDYERKQIIRECLMEAGIPYQDAPFIEEPTAALINYLFESKDPISINDELQNILIIDIGAGTVDVSIMQLSKHLEGLNSKLLAVERNGFIGGNLLDVLVAKKQIKNSQKEFKHLSESENSELLKLSENLKIKLCKEVETDSTVEFRLTDKAKSQDIVRINASASLNEIGIKGLEMKFAEFHSLMKDYWSLIEKTLNGAIEKGNLGNDDIKVVILNGGGSRNPYIQNFTKGFFKKSKIVRPDSIQEHVSKGAALNSFVLNSYGKQIVANIIAKPVCVWDGVKKIEIISSGETLPTFDVELYPEQAKSEKTRYLNLISNEQSVCFEIPESISVDKLIVFVNVDNEPECEIIVKGEIKKAARVTCINDSKLLKIKVR
jgi:molecular chaperone DnaK (HSP70)